MKKEIAEQISIFLLKKGFAVKSTKGCFDLLARKEEKLLLLKILQDANSINQDFVSEMKNIAGCINAIPLIIAEKSGKEMEDNVVYSRTGIFTLNRETFEEAINQKLPFIKSGKAGLAATLSGEKLRRLREENEMSLNYLSRKLGVSKRMVVNYEANISDISLPRALKLYGLFGAEVFDKVDIFSKMDKIVYQCLTDVGKKYADLGFEAIETKKSKFDVIAKNKKDIVLTTIGETFDKELNILSMLIDAENLLIFERRKPKIEIPRIAKEDFLGLENGKELIKIIKEF